MQFPDRIKNIGLSKIVEVSEKIKLMKEKLGGEFIYFQRGIVGLPTYEGIMHGLIEAFEKGLTKYPKSGGEPWFKQSVKNYLEDRGIRVNEKNVLAVYGGQEGLQLSFSLFEGRKCLTFQPCWSCVLENIFPYNRIHVLFTNLNENFEIDFSNLEKKLKEVDVLYLNSPHNPTGKVFSEEELEKINYLCKKHNIFIISDEAYNEIIYDGKKHNSMLQFDNPNLIASFSFSKMFAATGLRLGFIVCRNKDIIGALNKAEYTQTAGVYSVGQYAIAKALNDKENREKWFNNLRKELEKRRNLMYEELSKFINTYKPEGAFYFFINLNKYIKENVKNKDEFLLRKFLEERVAIIPGSAFGKDYSGYIRISFSTANEKEIKEGISRIRKVIEKLN